VPQPYTLADALAYLRGELPGDDQDTFAITDGDDRVLGSVGATAPERGVREIGYWLRVDARGPGTATQALTLIVAWAFGHPDVVRIQLRADPENDASRRVAERAGFTLEGVCSPPGALEPADRLPPRLGGLFRAPQRAVVRGEEQLRSCRALVTIGAPAEGRLRPTRREVGLPVVDACIY
jgi:Acetyltransferase (GNAT) domain